MSLRALTRVWESSRCKGSELLTLLAIADYARDDGSHAFPSIKKLAQKTRMCERSVQLILHKLEASGELRIEPNAGPYGCHLFHVIFPSPQGGARIAEGQKEPVQAHASTGCKQRPGEGVDITPNPSLDPKRDPSGFPSSLSTKAKKEQHALPSSTTTPTPPDETSSWSKPAVTLPDVRSPDVVLARYQLSLEAYQTLYTEARRTLLAEGAKAFSLITPIIEARMTLLLADQPVRLNTAHGCDHAGQEEDGFCWRCGEEVAVGVAD